MKGEVVEVLDRGKHLPLFRFRNTFVGMLATRGRFMFQALRVFWEMLEVRVDHDALS